MQEEESLHAQLTIWKASSGIQTGWQSVAENNPKDNFKISFSGVCLNDLNLTLPFIRATVFSLGAVYRPITGYMIQFQPWKFELNYSKSSKYSCVNPGCSWATFHS